ncbi:creatininase family protein [Sphingomonas sp. HF-S3]|uniref:Creatininase family protein n=1 Tax=Sphingomonas rustica TaxID=3103142 RepID=A0ABV0BCY0_9SPHN
MNLGDLPWTRVKATVDDGRPVVAILPLGAVEAHGPHLPLNTDIIISDGMARRAATLLQARDVEAFVLPAIAYAPAHYASEFVGTISISEATARALILDIARSLKGQGFACLALANSHFDPANVAMLRSLAPECAAIGLPLAFPDFTRRALAAQLTAEFVSGACHAGQFETSLVLADRPELVDDPARAGLADNPSSLVTAFAAGATNFTEAGGPHAYFGSPAGATAQEGEATFAIMAEALAASVVEAIR